MKRLKLSLICAAISGAFISGAAAADNLLDIYQLAQQKDPQVLRAKANVDINKAALDSAFSVLLPQLRATGSLSQSSSDGQFNIQPVNTEAPVFVNGKSENVNTNYTFSLTQEVFNLATWQRLDRAEKVALQAEVNYKLAQQNLVTRVTQAYFDVLRAQDNLTFVRAEKRAIERQLEQTKQRFAVGLTAITDVHEAQAQFDNAVATEIRTENDVEIAKEVLREITGKYHGTLSALNTDRFSAIKVAEGADEWVRRLESQNQELKAQQLTLDIAKDDIDIAWSGHLPTLTFNASTGRANTNRSIITVPGLETSPIKSNQAPTDNESWGLDLTVPIYEGGNVDATVRQAQANYVATSEDLESTHRRLIRSVRSSYADIVSLHSSIKALEQAVVSAESALKATEAGFEVGTRTIVDVLQSTQNLFSAKRNLSAARYDYINAMLNLKLAAGEISGADVEQINQGLVN